MAKITFNREEAYKRRASNSADAPKVVKSTVTLDEDGERVEKQYKSNGAVTTKKTATPSTTKKSSAAESRGLSRTGKTDTRSAAEKRGYPSAAKVESVSSGTKAAVEAQRAEKRKKGTENYYKTQASYLLKDADYHDVMRIANKYANDEPMLRGIQSYLADNLEADRKAYHKYGDDNVYFVDAEKDILSGNIPNAYKNLYDYDGFKAAHDKHQKSLLKYDYVSDILKNNFYSQPTVTEAGDVDTDLARKQAEQAIAPSELILKSTKPRSDVAHMDYIDGKGGSYTNAMFRDVSGAQETARETIKAADYYDKNKDNTYNNDLWGRIAANARAGDIGVRSASAGNTAMRYRSQNLAANDIYDALSQKLYVNNVDTYTNNNGFDEFIATASAYAPQWLGQVVEGWKGRILGTLAGAGVGYLTGGGPGAAKGAEEGWRHGYAAGSAKFMFEQTAGATYVELLRQSGDVNTAYQMANDTALATATVEYGLELAAVGFGKVLDKTGATELIENAGKKLMAWMTKKGMSEGAQRAAITTAKLAGEAAVNYLTESAEEGIQEGIAIQADRAHAKGESASPFALLARAFDFGSYSDEEMERIMAAARAGGALSFLGGGLKTGNVVIDALRNRRENKKLAEFEAYKYMLTKDAQEFDDLSPSAQKIVVKAFKDNPQDFQAFVQRKSPTNSITREAQALIDDAVDVIYGKKKTMLNGVDVKVSATMPSDTVITADTNGVVAVDAAFTPGIAKVTDMLSKRTGLKFGYAEHYQNGKKNAAYNGHYDPTTKTIYFRKGASKAEIIYKTAVHELTHFAESSKHYSYVSDFVLNKKFEDGMEGEAYKNAINEKISAYAKNGIELTPEEARRELVAENIREVIFKSKKDVDTLVRTDYTFAQRILDIIDSFIYHFNNKFGRLEGDAKILADLEQARRKYRLALASAKGLREGRNTEYEIVTLPDGKKYVQASKDKINSSELETAAKEVQDRIDDEVRHGRDVQIVADDGDVLTITIDTSWKAGSRELVTRPGGIKTPMSDDEFRTKLNAELHIDEIAAVSKRNSQTVPDEKNHAFAKDGFHYRKAYYRDYDGRYYRLGVSVGENGEVKTVYNIGYAKKTPFPNLAQRPGRKTAQENGVSNEDYTDDYKKSQEDFYEEPDFARAYRLALEKKNNFSFSSPKSDTEESIFDADVPMRHIDGSVRTYAEYKAEQERLRQERLRQERAAEASRVSFPIPDVDALSDAELEAQPAEETETTELAPEAAAPAAVETEAQPAAETEATEPAPEAAAPVAAELEAQPAEETEATELAPEAAAPAAVETEAQPAAESQHTELAPEEDAPVAVETEAQPAAESQHAELAPEEDAPAAVEGDNQAPVSASEEVKMPKMNEDVAKIVDDEKIKRAEDIDLQYSQRLKGHNSMLFKDLARVLDYVCDKMPSVRDFWRERIERPFWRAKALFASRSRNTLAQYKKDVDALGIRIGSDESAAAQWYGEGFRSERVKNPQYVKGVNEKYIEVRKKYTLNDLKREFPNKWEDIVKLDELNRALYDRYFVEINTVLKKIYPDEELRLEIELSDKQRALQTLRDKPAQLRDDIENIRADIDAIEEQLADLRRRRDEGTDITGTLDALEERRAAKESEYEALKNKGTKKAAHIARQATTAADKVLVLQESEKQRLAKAIAKKEAQLANKKKELSHLEAQLSERGMAIHREKIAALEAEIRDKRRAIDSGEALRNKRLPKRADYYHHFQEVVEGFAGLSNILFMKDEIDPELVGKSADTKPNTKWTGFMQRQGLGQYKADAVGGMLKYIQAAEYKIAFDPIIADTRSIIKTLAQDTKETINANGFILWLTRWTDSLAGKTSFLDRGMQEAINRKLTKVMRWLNKRTKSNTIVGSFRNFFSQFLNLPNGFLYVQDMKAWGTGIRNAIATLDKNSAAKRNIEQSAFLSERYLDDVVSSFKKTPFKEAFGTAHKAAIAMMNFGDKFASNIIWNAAYAQGQNKGIRGQELIEYADDLTRRSVAGRGVGETAPAMDSQWLQLVAPFQIEVNNTWNSMMQVIRNKGGEKIEHRLRALMMFEGACWGLNAITKMLGIGKVLPSALAALTEVFQVWFDDEEDDKEFTTKDKILKTFAMLGNEILSAMPFASTLLPILFDVEDVEQLIGEDNAVSRYGTGNMGLSGLLTAVNKAISGDLEGGAVDFVTGYATPWGGGQLKKFYEAAKDFGGANASGEAGSYTPDGRLRFPLDKNPWNILVGATLGKYATEEGKAYIDEERKPLSEEQTAEYNAFVRDGMSPAEAYKTVEILGELSGDVAKEKARDLMDSGFSAEDSVKHIKALGSIEGTKDEYGNAVSGSAKLKKLQYVYQLNIPDAEKGAIYRNCIIGPRDKELVLAQAFGVDDSTLAKVYPLLSLVEGTKDAKGNTIDGSKNKNIESVLRQLDLQPLQEHAFRVMFMTGKTQESYEKTCVQALIRSGRLNERQQQDFYDWYYNDSKLVDVDELIEAVTKR